ncbi:hypothetical protein FRC09_005036 [Ceratobasidium sp. 395]|nr:hypothetical protein FRC09_005036 [Ceratobasidium sp. 395]
MESFVRCRSSYTPLPAHYHEPPDPNKQNDLDASLLNLCTPSALPPTFGIESSYDWTSRSGRSWPPSLFEGEGIPNTTTESTVSNDGESDSGSIVEIWDEDDASRPPFPYLDTMAIESKGKAARRNKGQVAVKRPKPEGNALVKKTE